MVKVVVKQITFSSRKEESRKDCTPCQSHHLRHKMTNRLWLMRYKNEFLIKEKPIFYKELFQAGLWYMYDLNEHVIPFNVWPSRGVKTSAYMIWRGLVEICAKFKK